MAKSYSLSGISILAADSFIEKSGISIQAGNIGQIDGKEKLDFNFNDKFYLYPAIINVHDHFRGNYLPKVGLPEGQYYLNWKFWDQDLHDAEVVTEREKITIDDLYLLSAYKNLLSGVVTANDHFPHRINNEYIPKMPLRVIQEYAISHSCSSFSLNWGESMETEHEQAVEKNWPYIVHCEEGFDKETQSGLDNLIKRKCLDNHTVMIHCIGFSDKDIRETQKAGANVVWCPTSNIFMFNTTCKIHKFLEAGINVSLGTDATHSGSFNILAELRFAREIYKKMYGTELDPKEIYNMVTINPAKAFRVHHKTGSVEEGKLADLLLVKPRKQNPYEAFLEIQPEDIELLTMAGEPLLGSPQFRELFQDRTGDFTEITINKQKKLVKGDPAGLMTRIRKAVGFKKRLEFMPLDD
ncbi:MAG: amidohydrolase family protein [Spirochaetales bacterium]|nr:amidohydrolase family protein [Spirochaetales bacterium]